MNCPVCGRPARPEAHFCEFDGTRLIPPATPAVDYPPCPTCGAGPEAVDEDGFCTQCGTERGGPTRLNDHREYDQSPLAGVSDRGQRHPINEDAMALALADLNGVPAAILVVCDGVSASQHAQDAARLASDTALTHLRSALTAATGGVEEAMLHAAIDAAQQVVAALPADEPPGPSGHLKDPPETTIVAAVVSQGRAMLGWVGDSRAYAYSPTGCRMLTRDDSWVNWAVDTGRMTREEAEAAPERNAILQCLGYLLPDTPPIDIHTSTVELAADESVLLCTDGLWRYASEPEALAALLSPTGDEAEGPLALARRLVAYANAQGGADNVTAAILFPLEQPAPAVVPGDPALTAEETPA